MKKLYYHFFVLMLVSLLMPLVAKADVSVKVDRTNWSISACNTCPANYEGSTYNGNISAAIDSSTTTYYHSDWSGSSTTEGNSGLQAFLIDMGEDVADLCGFDYCARPNSASGHAYTCRVYVYADGALPDDLADLTALTSTTKETVLASSNTNLGTAVFNNSDDAWSYDANTDVKTGTFTSNTTGRYVLFIQDTGYDAWLTCADFNVYQAQSSATYTIHISGATGATATFAGTPHADGTTITAASEITADQITGSTVDGYYSAVTVSGTDIYVNYYKEYAKEGQAYLIKNVASGAFLNTTTLVSSNISIQTEGTPVYFTRNNGSWYINDASDNSGKYVYTDGYWNCKPSTTKTAWTIVETDTEGDYRLQCSTGYLAPDAASAGQALWTDKAATHSYGVFEIMTYDIDAYVSGLESAIANAQALIGTNPGNYEETAANAAIATAQAAIDASDRTITSIQAAQTALATALAATVIKPQAGKIYMLVSAYPGYLSNQSVEKAVYDNDGASSWKTLDGSDMSMYWYIQPDTEGKGYTIQNYSTNNYLSDYATTSTTETSWYMKGLAKGTYGYEYGLTKDSTFATTYGFLHTGGHSSGAGVSGNTTNWSTGADGASAWYIREVSDPNLNAAIASLQNKVDSCNAYIYGSNPGYYPATDSTTVKIAVAAAQAVLDGGATVATTYTTALSTLNTAIKNVKMIDIVDGGLYRLVSAYSGYTKNKSISALSGSYSPAWKNDTISDATEYWILTASGTGYTAKNAFTGKYLASPTTTTTTASEAAVLRFEGIGSGQFHFYFGTGTTPVHTAGWNWSDNADRQGPLTTWAGGVSSPSSWYIQIAEASDEATAATSTLATIQGVDKITLVDGATVIAPTEFAAPTVVNAAIATVDAISSTATVAEKGAAYVANQATINTYRNAVNNYGALLSVTYTPVKGWNTICLPVNWSCPDGWYRFNCDSLRAGSDTLSVSSCSGTKNTPMLIYSNNTDTYQFIGYSKGANDTLNVSNKWLTGIMVAADNKTVVSDSTTAYTIDATNQTITKAATATAVDLYHCYIKADSVLTYTNLHFPGCSTAALKNALTKANTYSSLIGTGLGKYTEATDGTLDAAVTEGTALEDKTDYSYQIQIDTAVVHLNAALSALSINQPETGKYYRIKETKGGTYFAARTADNYLVKESTKTANSIFYLDADKKLLSYSRGLYLTTGVLSDNAGNGCQSVSLAEADSANFSVQFIRSDNPGCYIIRNTKTNTNFYHWEWSNTNVIAMTNNTGDTRTFVTLEQVDSLPLSLTKVGDYSYATLYLPVAVQLCGDSVVAYSASVADSTLAMTAISGSVIPAETGVILKSTGATSGVAVVTSETATVSDNVLTGTIYGTHQENAENQNVYVFGTRSGALGFYRLTSSKALTGGHAYYDPATASVAAYKISFDDEATGILNVENQAGNAVIYDFSGRRVQKANKGIYIKDNKKFMVK